jgi:hypothetical protein
MVFCVGMVKVSKEYLRPHALAWNLPTYEKSDVTTSIEQMKSHWLDISSPFCQGPSVIAFLNVSVMF